MPFAAIRGKSVPAGQLPSGVHPNNRGLPTCLLLWLASPNENKAKLRPLLPHHAMKPSIHFHADLQMMARPAFLGPTATMDMPKCLPCNNRGLPTCLLFVAGKHKTGPNCHQIAPIVAPACNETKHLFPCRLANDGPASLSRPHGHHMPKCHNEQVL